MNVDVYIFFKLCRDFFQNFLSFLYSVLRVSPDTDLSRRDRSVSVPAESAAETATMNHAIYNEILIIKSWFSVIDIIYLIKMI